MTNHSLRRSLLGALALTTAVFAGTAVAVPVQPAEPTPAAASDAAPAAPRQAPAADATPSDQQPTPPAAAPQEAVTPPSAPRAFLDYSDGTFFLRSLDDNLVLATGGRVHIDTYGFFGPGVTTFHRGNGTGLAANMFFRRFVLEGGGLVRKHWFFWVGGNFAPTSVDGNQATTSTAAVYDGFVGYQFEPHLQLYVGQYNTPFMMENVTSSRWLDFMERALSVRTLGAPYNKDLGVTFWGASGDGAATFEYQVGIFGGDGMNRPNVDNRPDIVGRALVRPLSGLTGAMQRLHIGASARYGSRDESSVMYDAPTLSTPGGYPFWSPSYNDNGTEVHIIPSGDQLAVAAELYVPFERFDLKGEFLWLNEGRREATVAARRDTLRRGRLGGFGAYLQASYWLFGNPRVNGNPGGRYFGLRVPKNRGNEFPFGLQLVARLEAVRMNYDGNARSEAPDGAISAQTTNIAVNSAQFAVNYWATKHVRLTAEYSLYGFPGSPPSSGAATNQAAAPGARGSPAMPSASLLHEVSLRVGLAL